MDRFRGRMKTVIFELGISFLPLTLSGVVDAQFVQARASEMGEDHVAHDLLNDSLETIDVLITGRQIKEALDAIGALNRPEDRRIHHKLLLALGSFQEDAVPAVNAVIKFLHNEDSQLVQAAAEVLGQIGPTAKAAVPDLIQLAENENRLVSCTALSALRRIDPDSATRRFGPNHDATVAALADISSLKVGLHDWPQWGGSRMRNNVPHAVNLPLEWNIETGQNIKWSAELGSQTYGNPVIANGHVYIGTNNQHGYIKRFPNSVDLGVLLCFDEQTGQFLWQYSNPKLPTGRVHDWPQQGICATPVVDGDRLYVVTNRCEIVCLDTQGFLDNENDGYVQTEESRHSDEADVVWKLDMRREFGVHPHNMSTCCILIDGDVIFVTTSNGVDETHVHIPAPNAPSLLALDRNSGLVLWSDNPAGSNILHGQWASLTFAEIAGQTQLLFPAGDGWLYSYDPRGDGQGDARLLWKFDANPKDALYSVSGRSERNSLIGFACVDDGLVYIAVGDDPEHGEGNGHLWCIDPTRRGDVSPTLVVDREGQQIVDNKNGTRRLRALNSDAREKEIPNPNSAVVWHYTQSDTNQDGTIDFEEEMHRTIGTPAIRDDRLYITDFSGIIHCLNAKTGKSHWNYDTFAAVWGSPLIADGKVYIGDEDGEIAIFSHSSDADVAMNAGEPIRTITHDSSIYSSPVVANGVIYITTKNRLYAVSRPVNDH